MKEEREWSDGREVRKGGKEGGRGEGMEGEREG